MKNKKRPELGNWKLVSYRKTSDARSMTDTHQRNAKYPRKRKRTVTDKRRYMQSKPDEKCCLRWYEWDQRKPGQTVNDQQTASWNAEPTSYVIRWYVVRNDVRIPPTYALWILAVRKGDDSTSSINYEKVRSGRMSARVSKWHKTISHQDQWWTLPRWRRYIPPSSKLLLWR